MAKKIDQPALSYEQALMMVTEDKKESARLRDKEISMNDIRKGALLKVTDLMVSLDDSDPTRSCKCAAALTCNSWWSIKAFFGIGWRLRWLYYYYVKQYSDKELLPLVNLAKKKSGDGNAGIYDAYHILDRYENDKNSKKQGGSESFPSREWYGSAWSTCEKFPHLTASRFIFSVVEVKMWDYLWGMSEKQVELLLADQPVTIYLDNDKKSKGRRGVGADDMPAPSASAVLEAQKKWEAKYGDGSSKGKIKLNLGNILGKKDKDVE